MMGLRSKMTTLNAKKLPGLFKNIPVEVLNQVPELAISGLALDSRQVRPGDLFVALTGGQTNGHRFIPQAIKNGAVAVMGDKADFTCAVPYIQVAGNVRYAMAHIAAALHDFPARKLTMIGVTGTDGKTTTTSMIHQILLRAGYQAGMISTINAIIGREVMDTGFHVTTPEAPEVQAYLARMVNAGLTHAVLETTSHGLTQDRVSACDFDLAVVTNITHEHLDFHGSYQAYLEAKGLLFKSLAQTHPKANGNINAAILNKDDRSYAYLKRISPKDQISYSMVNKATLWADEIQTTAEGLRFRCHIDDQEVMVECPLIGIYNVSNCLAALGACVLRLGVPLEAALQALKEMPQVPGRMQRIDFGQDFTSIVDFAHTPNALQRALETARELTIGRVIAVFGSAGLRDQEKRRMMPEVSIENADLTILTAEDPRTEDLEDILADMADAAVSKGGVEGETFWRIPDRPDAIRFALRLAEAGDLVIVCGKGHEQSMCFGTTEYDWDDRTAVRAALAEMFNIPGYEMPRLPTSQIV